MSIEREIEVTLGTPVQIADGDGGMAEVTEVVLKAPTARNRKFCAFMKQQFLICLPKGGDQGGSEKGEEDPTHEDVIHLLGSSTEVDLAEVLEVCRKLFVDGGSAYVLGKKMKAAVYDSLAMDDAERLLGEYMLGFLLGSVLEKQKSS